MPQTETVILAVLSVIAIVLFVESILKARKYAGTQHHIIFMGAPGAGKGTQATRLAKELQIPHLSSGDLLRRVATENTPIGEKIRSHIEKGELAPDELINSMIAGELQKCQYEGGFILDGYPRTVEQAEFLDDYLDKSNRFITAVFDLHVDEDVLVERIVGRRICGNGTCAATYHLKNLPPKVEGICDRCGRPLIERKDDTEIVLRERIERHEQRIVPLLGHYHSQGNLITISGEGHPADIFDEILLTIGI